MHGPVSSYFRLRCGSKLRQSTSLAIDTLHHLTSHQMTNSSTGGQRRKLLTTSMLLRVLSLPCRSPFEGPHPLPRRVSRQDVAVCVFLSCSCATSLANRAAAWRAGGRAEFVETRDEHRNREHEHSTSGRTSIRPYSTCSSILLYHKVYATLLYLLVISSRLLSIAPASNLFHPCRASRTKAARLHTRLSGYACLASLLAEGFAPCSWRPNTSFSPISQDKLSLGHRQHFKTSSICSRHIDCR